MEAFSALLDLCARNTPVTGEFPSQRPVTRSFDFFLICAWINAWVNNREYGDLRRNDTVVICAQFRGDSTTEQYVIGKGYFMRFEFKMRFGRIYDILTAPNK